MKSQARAINTEPVLVDRSAKTFGGFRDTLKIRSRIKANGTLALYEDRLVYTPPSSDDSVEIRIEDIKSLGVVRFRAEGDERQPVLRVTHHENVVFGVHVSEPERWLHSIEGMASGQGIAPELEPPRIGSPLRHSRAVILVFLIIVLLVSVALPVIFTWMHGKTLKERSPVPPPTALPTAG